MQDRYAGDVGDFMKLALLNRLRAPSRVGEDALSVSIVWYLVDDESHNADGKHVSYLDPTSDAGRTLRQVDPGVYDALATVVSGPRSVAALEASGALAPGTVSFSERLRLTAAAPHDRTGRIALRDRWVERASAAVSRTEIVTLDPDNGIRTDDHPIGRHRAKSDKHSYVSEIARLARPDQTLVAYHHADRSEPVEHQVRRRLADLAVGLDRAPLAAVRTSRGSTRMFLVVPAPAHRERLERQLRAISEDAVAAREFSVTRWDG